ncbi:MAG TPA: PAS domain-containing protein, partial [Candidatus Thermoplasmatota archaeon]|nr:PAS domain-containing protein [Candidatus Thermoplasmatota archaeon]
TILETLPEGIVTMDLAGRITYANVAAERILGRAARDITERSYFDPAWSFTTPEGDVFPVTALPFLKAISTGASTLGSRLGVERGDGKTIQLVLNTVPLPDANGVPYALLVSFRETAAPKRRRPATDEAPPG